MRNLTSPVLPPLMFFAALLAWVLPGCSSNRTDDGFVSMGSDTGGAAAVPGAGGGGTKVGGGGAQASGGGAQANGGGAQANGGTATAGNDGTNANTGGTTRRVPDTSTGGNTVIGTSVCDYLNVCGKVIDAKGDVYDCGFNNCPQEVCGLYAPNQCPPACTSKITCSDTNCGKIPDGCGGILDCGFGNCPEEVCAQTAPYQCPAACKNKIDCKSAGNKDCGWISDGCGGVVDCGSTNCPPEMCGLFVPNQCPATCLAKIDCKSAGNKDCGWISDGCGEVVDCGSTNCPPEMCGLFVPNQCPSACLAKIDCKSAGNKDCGWISDGCGEVIDCGTCTEPQCCGCAATGQASVPNVCGGGESASKGSGLTSTCLAGSKGCLCDTRGGCAPGLACNTTKTPNVCCSGSDCTPARTNIGATCAGTGVASCTPGITIPSATGVNDNCGYPESTFKENVFMCGIFAQGGGPVPAQIQAFMNDEHAMTLGCETAAYPVSAMPANPGAFYYPQTGDPTCVDTENRPMRPSLYITDITSDPNCRAGDQQQGGEPYDPIAVFGTWKAAVGNTPGTNPTPLNYWNLGTAADPVPAAAIGTCPCVEGSCVTTGHDGRGYGIETRFEAALLGGHSYRFQVIGHDGDQTQGADAGEACVIFCSEGDLACVPTPCPTEFCGKVGDGCGGILDCGPCNCVPTPCPTEFCGKVGDGCGGILDCGPCSCVPTPCPPDICGKYGDGCGGVLDCGPCCVPQTCGPQMCGQYPDSCGGIIDCGPCCVPWTCEDFCPEDTSGNIRECTSVNDAQRYILPCKKPDGCFDVLDCWCPIG